MKRAAEISPSYKRARTDVDQIEKAHIENCYLIAANSPDPSTHSGVVITSRSGDIISTGFNNFPQNVKNMPDRLIRPLKYQYIEHAERNAIYEAARDGRSTKGGILYVNWLPCIECSRAIIQSGIKRVIVHKAGQDAFTNSRQSAENNWKSDHEKVINLLQEADVEFEWYTGNVAPGTTGKWSGKVHVF